MTRNTSVAYPKIGVGDLAQLNRNGGIVQAPNTLDSPPRIQPVLLHGRRDQQHQHSQARTEKQIFVLWQEQFQWFATIGLLFLVVEHIVRQTILQVIP